MKIPYIKLKFNRFYTKYLVTKFTVKLVDDSNKVS